MGSRHGVGSLERRGRLGDEFLGLIVFPRGPCKSVSTINKTTVNTVKYFCPSTFWAATEIVHRQRWCGGTLDESRHRIHHGSPVACDSAPVSGTNDETAAVHLQLMGRDIFGCPPASGPSWCLVVLGSVVRASCVALGLQQAPYFEVE